MVVEEVLDAMPRDAAADYDRVRGVIVLTMNIELPPDRAKTARKTLSDALYKRHENRVRIADMREVAETVPVQMEMMG